jgi:hypothetical protein
MRKLTIEILFFIAAAAIILPAPTLLLAYVTGQTWREILYR